MKIYNSFAYAVVRLSKKQTSPTIEVQLLVAERTRKNHYPPKRGWLYA